MSACGSTKSVESGGKKGTTVSGSITYTTSHCGGARPTEQMMQNHRTQRPNEGAVLYVKSGTVNNIKTAPIDSVKADKDGNFSIKLPAGDYILVDKRRADSQFFQKMLKEHGEETDYWSPVDVKCLKEFCTKPIMKFTVASVDLKLDNINIHRPCNWKALPCMVYKGPFPP